jgi:hypothetical protein
MRAPSAMNVDTYRSARIEGLFVTLASAGSEGIVGIVDELAMLDLEVVRRDDELTCEERHAGFARFVMTEIFLQGYAAHGWDGSTLRGCSLPHRRPQGPRQQCMVTVARLAHAARIPHP